LEDAFANGPGAVDVFFFHVRIIELDHEVDEASPCRLREAALDSQYVARCAGHERRSRFERRGPPATC
jgi:hypothetical protein